MYKIHLVILRDCGTHRVFDKIWYFDSEENSWFLCDAIITKYELKAHPDEDILSTFVGEVDGADVIVTSKYHDDVEWDELPDIISDLPDLV